MYGIERRYEWNLMYVVEWMLNNLEYIIGYDPFPVFQSEKNLNDMLAAAYDNNTNNDLEFELWYGALHSWTRRHAWDSESGGSLISEVYFYRRGNKMEIAWNNENKADSRIEYKSVKGFETIDIRYFINVIFSFLESITEDLYQKDKNNETFKELREKMNFWTKCKENKL